MPAKFQVFGLINHTHATSPEFAEDTVVGYLLADHKSAGRFPGDNRGNVRPLSDSGQLPCSVLIGNRALQELQRYFPLSGTKIQLSQNWLPLRPFVGCLTSLSGLEGLA